MIKHLLKLVWARKRSNALLILEVFVSFLVVYAVVVLAIYFADNYRHPIGFSFRDVWVVTVDTGPNESDEEGPERLRQVYGVLDQLPEIDNVSGANFFPYSMAEWTEFYSYESRHAFANGNGVTDDFNRVMGLQLIRGRWFEPADDALNWTPVVINERMSKMLFQDQDPLGKRITHSDPRSDLRVVGVVVDYRESGEFSGLKNYIFHRRKADRAYEESMRNLLISVRPGTDIAFEETLSRRLEAVAPGWTFDIQPLAMKRELFNRWRLLGLQAAGLVALFLMLMVGLGLTGVLWQNVIRRMEEFGLRRAVGGTARRVRTQVLLELVLVISIGMVMASILIIQAPLMGMIGLEQIKVWGVALLASYFLVYLMAILAGLYPSLLATRIHPAAALHYE